MEFIHCNVCYQYPSKNSGKFHLAGCGHIYCDTCVKKIVSDKCSLCGKKSTVIEIGERMGKQAKDMFTDPLKFLGSCEQQFASMVKFQTMHMALMFKSAAQQSKQMRKTHEYCERELKKMQDLEKESNVLKEEVADLTQRVHEAELLYQQAANQLSSQGSSSHMSTTFPMFPNGFGLSEMDFGAPSISDVNMAESEASFPVSNRSLPLPMFFDNDVNKSRHSVVSDFNLGMGTPDYQPLQHKQMQKERPPSVDSRGRRYDDIWERYMSPATLHTPVNTTKNKNIPHIPFKI